MSRRSSNRVSFSPDHTTNTSPTIFTKPHNHPITTNKKPQISGSSNWTFKLLPRDSNYRLSRSSSFHFLRRLGDKTARVLRLVSAGRSSRNKVSSSASLVRSRSLVDQTESHRAEAIEDCIEFLNSYSSLHRSSSVSLTAC